MLGKEKTNLIDQLVLRPSLNWTIEQKPTKSSICFSERLNTEVPQNTSESFSYW